MTVANQTPRILLLGDGRQVHIARWADYLLEVGYDVVTVSLEGFDAVPGKTHRIYMPTSLPHFLRYPLAVPGVRKLIKRFRPHLINAHFLPNYGVLAAMTGFRPWVLSVWGSDIMVLPEQSAFQMRRTKWVLSRAAHVTSDAEVMSKKLVRLGVDPGRIATFPYGVDRRRFRLGISAPTREGPRLLSNRKLHAVYNIKTLITAFPRIRSLLPGAVLTVAGEGADRQPLEAISARIAPVGSIQFVGQCAHDRVPDLLQEHDIFVSLSLSDTTSVSLLEAMACGLLPVVSDIPANHEWIEDGVNGILVDPLDSEGLVDAVCRAWDDEDFRAAAAARNQKIIAERADWYRNMETIKVLFGGLIER